MYISCVLLFAFLFLLFRLSRLKLFHQVQWVFLQHLRALGEVIFQVRLEPISEVKGALESRVVSLGFEAVQRVAFLVKVDKPFPDETLDHDQTQMFLLFGLEMFIRGFIALLFDFPGLRESFSGLIRSQAFESGFKRILLLDLFHDDFFLHVFGNLNTLCTFSGFMWTTRPSWRMLALACCQLLSLRRSS